MTHEWEFADRADDAETTFAALAERIVDEVLARDPVAATWLGEHRYDGRLPDLSQESVDETLIVVDQALSAVDQIDDVALGTVSAVDLEILRTALTGQRFALGTLRPHTWDPLLANPGTAIHLLLSREFAPLEERLESVASRLDAVPESLAVARETLEEMPRVHLETAIGQFEGTQAMLGPALEGELDGVPTMRSRVAPARDAAAAAIDAHLGWLRDRLDSGLATGDPRLGAEKYAAKLWTTLDAHLTPDDVLHRAESDLARIEGDIARAAAAYLGEEVPPPDDAGALVRRALDAVAADGTVTNDTVLDLCRAAFDSTRAFVESNDLVTVFDIPMEIIEMPEIHRGVAVAYCDAPGPLETTPLPTYFAVSPTPSDWVPSRVESFFREYNSHMVHNLTIHEAMPGHVLQLGHSRRYASPTRVRQAFSSGPFAEGWAVYAEALMAERGYDAGTGEQQALAVRLQQLKMQLRMTINAILDVRVHTRGMTEDEGMRLMQVRGHQEEGEAVGKWRRALLTSCQLSTYYVGYIAVNDIVLDLRAGTPGWTDRALHDAVLAHGSPPPRHLRTLLGI
jgi:uncharacterized protein (DUF885 family)